VLRHKFYSLLEGYVAPDEECEALLVPAEETGRIPVPPHLRKNQFGKHNMAKGALKPEDAAVSCPLWLIGQMAVLMFSLPLLGTATPCADREECASGARHRRVEWLVVGAYSKSVACFSEKMSPREARHMHVCG
jgi:hypothetical protein